VFVRLSWRTVTGIVARVVADLTGTTDQLDGLRRIGIDEIAYRKGHRYLTCVVDHDTGRLVWAHEGRNKDTLTKFFHALGESRSALLTHVSADGAEWIHAVVREQAPQGGALPRPVSRGRVGDQGVGQGPPPDPGAGRRERTQTPAGR